VTRAQRAAVALLLLFHLLLLAWLAAITPWTTDEPNYLAAGIALRTHFDFQPFSTILHGPLPFLMNQAGALFTAVEPHFDYKLAGRLGMLPFALLAAWATWRLARDAFGPRAGLAALLLHVLNPVGLAHGCLMTADMALTGFFVLVVWQLWRWRLDPTPGAALRVGLATGLALATKFLALFLLPLLACAFLAAARVHSLARVARAAALTAVAAWGTLWACYGFQPPGYAATVLPIPPGGLDPQDPKAGVLSASLRRLVELPAVPQLLRLLPEPFVRGVDYQKHYSEQGGVTVFWGRVGRGFPHYFLTALLVKLPLALLLLLALGLCLRSPPSWPKGLPLILWTAVLVPLAYLSFLTTLQIGVRYLLPVLPLLCVVAARAVVALPGRRGAAIQLAALLSLLLCHAQTWPHYLCAFNWLAKDRPYLLFQDSNLAWVVREHRDPEGEELARQHPDSQRIHTGTGPTLGLLRVFGPDLSPPDPRDSARVHHWLRRFVPVQRLGAWFLFDVQADAYRALAADDPRASIECALSLLAAGQTEIAPLLERGSADPGAARARRLLQLLRDRRTEDPEWLQLWFEAGREDLVLAAGERAPAQMRASAMCSRGEPGRGADLLEQIETTRRLTPNEAKVLAYCQWQASRPDAALATLARYQPPPESPDHDAWQLLLRKYERDARALRLIQGQAQGR
jgi:4-amino-4-deoxy-L-arabinose transferase-like glycosyltransferase